jgi:hypothetical protein
MKKIKIDLSKGNFGERKNYKKGDVVVCNYKGIDQEPFISIVHRCEEETASISNKNGIESYSVYWLRLATTSEKKLLGTRYFAEIEDISQVKNLTPSKPTEVETLKAEIKKLKTTLEADKIIIRDLIKLQNDVIESRDKAENKLIKSEKQVNDLQTKAEVWENHAKHVEKKLIEAEQELSQFSNTIDVMSRTINSHEANIENLHKEIETITKYGVEQIKLILKNE